MKRVLSAFATLVLYLACNHAQAIDILCSKKPKSAAEIKYEEEDGGFTTSGDLGGSGMSINELLDGFANGAGVKSNQPVMLCLFPQTHRNSIELFESLGIDNSVINTFFNERNIVIRRTRLVRSDSEMISCVKSAYPSLGYIASTPEEHQNLKCF